MHTLNKLSSLSGITSFVRTVRAGSFAAAARELRITAVAVSKNVATLERHLGVRLFQRSTRKLSLTEEGRAYHERCVEPLRALEEASAAARDTADAPNGLVRVTCLVPFGRTYVLPLLQSFSRRYPQIEIDLRLDDHLSDMVGENLDVGIRAGAMNDPVIIARKICALNFVVCGAPAYFAQFGIPKQVKELAKHNCLRLGRGVPAGTGAARDRALNWYLGPKRIAMDPPVRGSLVAGDLNSLEQAALHGIGLANLPLPLVIPHFYSGRLRPVLPTAMSSGLFIYLHYRSRRNQPARLRLFIDYMLGALRSHPDLAAEAKTLCAPYWA